MLRFTTVDCESFELGMITTISSRVRILVVRHPMARTVPDSSPKISM